MDVCTGMTGFIESYIIFPTALISILTTLLIAFSYMIGNAIQNPKLLVWAKTEVIQLVVSIASVLVIVAMINSLCMIPADAASALTDVGSSVVLTGNLYDGAATYLKEASIYTHTILSIERYHLMAYDFLSLRSIWHCGGWLDCWGSSIGLSGKSYAWAPYFASGFNMAFNSVLFSYLFTLNALFILQYVNSGFVLFFLPFGIFFRAFPYLRKLGSLFIAMTFAFVIVYPLILSSFILISEDLFDYIDPLAKTDPDSSILAYTDESLLTGFDFGDAFASAYAATAQDVFGDKDEYIDDYIFTEGRKEDIALQLAGRAFLVGVFIPTLALVAAIASVSMISRELGEEIDLSRIVQMV